MPYLIRVAALALFAPLCAPAQLSATAQVPAAAQASAAAHVSSEAFASARAVVLAHTSDDIFLDNSLETFTATRKMWTSLAAFLIAQHEQNPRIAAAALDESLCRLSAPSPEVCTHARPPQVVALSPTLFLVSPTVGPLSTVFLLGLHNDQMDIVWSIDDPQPQPEGVADERHLLLEAWLPNRVAADCIDGEHPHPALACGPLAPSIGVLPADASGHPRFFVDAAYFHLAGASVTKQTSVWTWRGAAATLDWIGTYALVADQPGPAFDAARNTLVIPQKGFFHIMSDCGTCVARPLEQRILLGPQDVQDLGVRSLAPEMDAIDTFFWRLAHYESTKGVATFPPTFELRNKVRRATDESQKISPDFYSIGMVTNTITATKSGAHVCLVTDTLGPMNVSLRRNEDGNFVITHISKSARITCPEGDTETEVASN